MLVVAGALSSGDGRWLMHRRPYEKHHGGLWEFPGGKVELSEIPAKALCRELKEELGITIRSADCHAVTFAEGMRDSGAGSIVILLYKVVVWEGEPRSLEAGEIAWMTPQEVHTLDKPPLDHILAQRLFGD